MLEDDSDWGPLWLHLEEHLKTGKPIVGRIIEVVPGSMLVDVQGIQTSLAEFVIGYTCKITPEVKSEERQFSEEELRESIRKEAYASIQGKEMLFRVVVVNREQHLLKLSQHKRKRNDLKPVRSL